MRERVSKLRPHYVAGAGSGVSRLD
jgi:hypothetical protein